MNSILHIIHARGGLKSLKVAPSKSITVGTDAPITISYQGQGPRKMDLLQVEREGRKLTFEIYNGLVYPVSLVQGSETKTAVWSEDGAAKMELKVSREIKAVMVEWDREISEHGYVTEASRAREKAA